MKQPSFHARLFKGKSFVEIAIAISKMSALEDFKPLILKDFGLTLRDLEHGPIRANKAEIDKRMEETPDSEDEVYGMQASEISNHLASFLWSVAGSYFAKNCKAALQLCLRSDDLIEANNLCLVWVLTLHRQLTFLWYAFHATRPTVDIVTAEACDLVNETKLDSKITKEMLDDVFKEDLVLHLKRPVEGYCDIALLKREKGVYVTLGQTMKGQTFAVKNGYADQPFTVVGHADTDSLAGHMTNKAIVDDVYASGLKSETDLMKTYPIFEYTRNDLEQRAKLSAEMVASAVEFGIKLRILLGMEKTPIAQLKTTEGTAVSLDGVSSPPGKRGVSYSVISLTREFVAARNAWKSEGKKLDKFGKDLVPKQISGFIRKQHYGEGNKLSKFIYIAPFTNHFWVNTGVKIRKVVK